MSDQRKGNEIMKNNELNVMVKEAARMFGFTFHALRAVIEVETGGVGFDPVTRKIIIQFEPAWFRKKAPYAPSGKWSVNKVERQSQEWIAFNDAFAANPNAAMESTSVGLGQIMGFHFSRLGYKSVGDMWDDAKRGIERQIWQLCKFIKTDARLMRAMLAEDWTDFATIFNGAGFRELARKYGRVPYNVALGEAANKWKKFKF